MKEPLQTLLKINMKEIKIFEHNDESKDNKEPKIEENYIKLNEKELKEHSLKQQHNLLLRQIKLITKNEDNFIKEFILIDCSVGNKKNYQEKFDSLLRYGFNLNNDKFVLFGKSSSQAKEGIICFVQESISKELNERITLNIDLSGKMVISKIEAYLKLVMSSCEFLTFTNDKEENETYMPRIVVVDDYKIIIENQYIKYVDSVKTEFFNKNGELIRYNDWQIKEGYKDIPLEPFDGMGVHSFEMNDKIRKCLGIEDEKVVSFQVRCVGLKGLSTAFDIHRWFKKYNIKTITDVWGNTHKVEDIDCIWTKSQFKLKKYFESIDDYISRLKKYNHVIGVSKYNKTLKQEKAMFRMNFQYLQVLNLNKDKIFRISKYTKDLYEKIINGDEFATIKFLGLLDSKESMDEENANSNYMKALLINPDMIYDRAINRNIYESLKKRINELKTGKCYVNGRYSFAVGDMVGFMEYVSGMEVNGCLEAKQLYSKGELGTRAVFRSPLMHSSEINKVEFVENELTNKWCSHLENINMFNLKDISLPQEGGQDLDGDLNAVTDNKDILNSVIISPIIIDVQDKATTDEVEYNIDNLIKYHSRTLDSRIGEITNVSSAICNRDDYLTGTKEQHKRLDDYIAICRILQGKEIDYVKTGLRFEMRHKIKKTGKKLPYFLIYKYPNKKTTLDKIKKKNKSKWKKIEEETNGKITPEVVEKYGIIPTNVIKSKSPLNLNCIDIEKWERDNFLWNNNYKNTSHLLINQNVKENEDVNKEIRKIYREYLTELKEIKEDLDLKSNDEDKKFDGRISRLIDNTKNKILGLKSTDDEKYDRAEIVNSCVLTSYKNNYPSFAWIMVGDDIVKNLKNNTDKSKQRLIIECDIGDKDAKEFLGKYYKFINIEDIEGFIY